MARRILHLMASNELGGSEKQLLYHAADMRGAQCAARVPGYEVSIGSFQNQSDPNQSDQDQPETPEILVEAARRGLPTFSLSGGLGPRSIRELASLLRQGPADLLWTHGSKANVVGYFAAREAGIPHVAMVREEGPQDWRGTLLELPERRVLRRTRWIACDSPHQAERLTGLRENLPAPVIIRDAILPPFATEGHHSSVTRVGLHIPPLAFVFGVVGKLTAEKGHRLLLEAFRRVRDDYRGSRAPHLIVLGDGREHAALEDQARDLGIQVHFAGCQENCADWMRLFDCMVVPSVAEGSSDSVLEALCLQIPVIATSAGSHPDLIHDHENGLLVPPDDASSLAAAMNSLLLSPQLCRRLSVGAADTREESSPERQRASHPALYQTSIAVRPRPFLIRPRRSLVTAFASADRRSDRKAA